MDHCNAPLSVTLVLLSRMQTQTLIAPLQSVADLRGQMGATAPGGVLYIIWVRGRAIGKGIVFHDFGIRNGIDFHDFGIRSGIDFRNFCNWYRIGYAFSENWYKVEYICLKNWYKVGETFWKNWYKERVCF